MFTTVLPIGGVALLLSLCCWSVGSALVSSRSPVVALLAGWCGFLFLCVLAWIAGLSARAMMPAFILFYMAGVWFMLRRRTWADYLAAILCTAAMTFLLGYPFLSQPGLLAYGAHGLDMWGYIDTAEWLQAHSVRDLPPIGESPMRFNWTWYVLRTRERPLIYESLACLASSTGLTVAQAYVAYPIALLSGLALALSREPGIFRLPSKWALLAVPVTVALAFHPLIVLPWIAGFFGGSITGLFIGLALAAMVVPGDRRGQSEAIALAALMLVLCGALYTNKLALVGLAVGGVPLVFLGAKIARERGWRGVFNAEPAWVPTAAGQAIIATGGALLLLGANQQVGVGQSQAAYVAWSHLLGMFGGTSPYAWMGYRDAAPFDHDLRANPVGVAALVAMAALFIVLIWRAWRGARDLRLAFVVALAAGLLVMARGDETTMARTLAIFGFALLPVLAVAARGLRHWTLVVAAAVLCALPSLRSAAEMREIIRGPYITFFENDTMADILDGQDWRVMSFQAFREDRDGCDWSKYPRTFHSETVFLPMPVRAKLAARYHLPPPE